MLLVYDVLDTKNIIFYKYYFIILELTVANLLEKNWSSIAAGGGGGGAVALILLVVLICCVRRANSSK